MALLEIEHISKAYRGGVLANDDISLSVEAGEVFGLLGPNGAGKTTLVNQIIGLLAPTSGTIQVAGVNTVEKPGFARQACSFQPQTQVPIEGMTPYQAIELSGRLRGGKADQVRARAVDAARDRETTEPERSEGPPARCGLPDFRPRYEREWPPAAATAGRVSRERSGFGRRASPTTPTSFGL